jgi:LacI family gluconate utilization system Gnt-I transcriptional repressor
MANAPDIPDPHQRQDRVTLRDVARLAGVSDISVSRVMRNAPNISDNLRDRVRQAADQLGYTPNRVAGALKAAQGNLVAVVLPSMSNEVFPEVLDGIESVLSQHGLCAVLGITKYDPAREVEVVRELLSWSPMGVILTGLSPDPAIRRMLAQQAIPVVQIMDVDGDPIQTAVGMSHVCAARAAADHLIDRGYRHPSYIGAWAERPDRSRARRLAFAARARERGFPLVGHMIVDEPSSATAGARALRALLARHPQADCVFFANDDLAVGGLLHCLAEGIAVPDRLAILGFNGIELGQALPVPLTSIRTPRYEMGVRAAEILAAPVSGAPRIIDLGFHVTEGQST